MIQRSPIRPPARKVNLPLTTNDSNHLQKTPKKKRHRPVSKSLMLVRVIGATLVLFVVFLYIAGTRHVLSIGPSETSLPTMNDFSEILHELPKVVAPVVSHKPRSVGYYFALVNSNSFVGTERLDPNMEMRYDKSITRIYRETLMTAKDMRRQEALTHSKSYEDGRADVWSDMGEDCVPQYDWQDKSYPTCNTVMEVDMTNINYLPVFHEDHYNNRHDEPLASSPRHSYMRLITWGGWRSVWSVENFVRHKNKTEEQVVFKTQLYEHDIEERNFDRHRRDGVAMERLTASKFIMDIYAFCGNSGLFEYADGGDLETSIYSNYNPGKDSTEVAWSSEEKMVVAYQAASGLADLHNFAKEGVPAVAHTDITGDQWVYVEQTGVYKLNDFNRGRFLGKHNNTDELCTYTVGNNPGRWRSPEEYSYEEQTEKIDIYSFGNLLFRLATGKNLFWNEGEHLKNSDVQDFIIDGERSEIPDDLKSTTDPFEKALLQAIEGCWKQDPKERPSARELQNLFVTELEKKGVPKTEW